MTSRLTCSPWSRPVFGPKPVSVGAALLALFPRVVWLEWPGSTDGLRWRARVQCLMALLPVVPHEVASSALASVPDRTAAVLCLPARPKLLPSEPRVRHCGAQPMHDRPPPRRMERVGFAVPGNVTEVGKG